MKTLLWLIVIWLALPGSGWAQPGTGRPPEERYARTPRGLERLKARVSRVPQVKDLTAVLDNPSPLTRSLGGRLPEFGNDDNGVTKTFSVELGHGLSITGSLKRTISPLDGSRSTRFTELHLENAGRRRSLLPQDTSVFLASDTSFDLDKGNVYWHGPVSRLAVFALLHELGHRKDHQGMSGPETIRFGYIYGDKNRNAKLTDLQHRQMVGLEGRAWASALKSVRQLRTEGFDLFPDVSKRELLETMYGCLKGYCEYGGKTN